MKNKICPKCKTSLPVGLFYKRKDGTPRSWCKECNKSCAINYYKKNPEYNRDKSRVWRLANPEKVKATKEKRKFRDYLTACRRKYNIEPTDFIALLNKQEKRCAICRCSLDYQTKDNKPHLDHCHKTLAIRGLLCRRCNSVLGYVKDDISILRAAIIYLGGK